MSQGLPKLPALWPYLLICVVASLLIDLSTFHHQHSSDSLLPVLISLQHWTPFFWLQDRVGMLVPLLAMPIRHPLANLLMQEALYVFSGLAAILLLARYMLRDSTYPLVGMASAAAMVAFAPPAWCFNLFANTFYGVWLALGLGGLVLLDGESHARFIWVQRASALMLLILAHWAYCAAALLLGSLVICRAMFFMPDGSSRLSIPGFWPRTGSHDTKAAGRESSHQTVTALTLLAVAFAIGIVFMRIAPEPIRRTPMGTLGVTHWPNAWNQLAQHTWSHLGPQHWPYLLIGGAGIGCLLLCASAVRRTAGRAVRAAAALAAAAILFGLFLGTRRWISTMAFSAHYTLPVVFVLQMAMVVMAISPLCAILAPIRRALCVFSGPALVAAVLYNFGAPSLNDVRGDFDQRFGKYSSDLVAGRSTHFAGRYWNVWPAVFHANLILHEQHISRVIWGVTYRGEVTQQNWRNMVSEDMRVAVPAESDSETAFQLDHFGFAHLTTVESRPTIHVLRPQSAGVVSKN